MRYDLHRNSPKDPHYVQYLHQFIEPLVTFLKERDLRRGIDWGSGPGPTLSGELRKLGFEMQNFDPLYSPEKPQTPVDFVTATEVIEHFQEPKKSLQELLALISSGGLFGGMTGFHSAEVDFSQWWYARDPTHVIFFSEKTFRWLAKEYQLKVLWLASPIFIFRVPGS